MTVVKQLKLLFIGGEHAVNDPNLASRSIIFAHQIIVG